MKAKLKDRGALITEIGLRIYDFYSRKVQILPDHRFFGNGRLRLEYPDFEKGIIAAGLLSKAASHMPNDFASSW